MKVALLVLAGVLVAIALLEIVLRVCYGLGNPPLYVADGRTGYRLAPNQRLKRFGNQIAVNEFSMRGPAILPQRPEGTLRVLMLGDSIVNGGWWTDQTEILSQQVQDGLQGRTPFSQVEVLNASANSWGPRNELGYIARFGLFEAQLVLVVLNTDDLFAIAPTSLQVGRDRSYPQRKPLLAIFEALNRLQKPRALPELEALHQQAGDRVGSNLEALRQIQLRTEADQGRLLLAMTPLRRELEDKGPRDYELVARQRLLTFTQTQQIPYLDFLLLFQQSPDFAAYYRDHIHLSPQGNRFVSEHLATLIASLLAQTLGPSAVPDSDEGDLWR